MPESDGATGRIFEIQRFSIHDGPGIRTTVFLQGCPLRCVWCHNPEGRASSPLLSFQPDKCVGCGYCFRVCPRSAHQMLDGAHVLDRERCAACGSCAAECYARALELVGGEATVEEVLTEVLADRPFYETSGGGMTLSGGEPLIQIDFAAALLRAARRENLHCCVETCGFVPFFRLEGVLPFVDLFLYDLKDMDDGRHVEFTGGSSARIIENLGRLHDRGACIRLRLPLIPGYNDRDDHFAAVADLVHSLPGLAGVELMPYHRLGTSKLPRFGLEQGDEVTPPAAAAVDRWIDRFADLGVDLLNRRSGETVKTSSSRKSSSHVSRR